MTDMIINTDVIQPEPQPASQPTWFPGLDVLMDIWTKDITANLTQPGKDPRRKFGIGARKTADCRSWLGKTKQGLPVIHVADRVYYVADLLLESRKRRPLSEGMAARHTCEDPKCVEINHLYEGPRLELPRAGFDGRTASHTNSKLTATMVREIRDSPDSDAQVAATLGVSTVTIWKVRKRKTWKFVA